MRSTTHIIFNHINNRTIQNPFLLLELNKIILKMDWYNISETDINALLEIAIRRAGLKNIDKEEIISKIENDVMYNSIII